jgi:flavin reductase (DIM6/NTAB) family NADH-FMN oxidoreductase RutF
MSVHREQRQDSNFWSGNGRETPATLPKVYGQVDEEAFRKGMRQLSAAVTIVTTGTDAQHRAGLTATAVCSVSAKPPQLLVCVNRRGEAHTRIREWRNFCVNVLCHAQIGIAKRFAGMERGTQPERFELGKWGTLTTGAPVLADCLANFDCRLQQEVESGTHSIFIGEIVAISVHGGKEPLAFLDGQFLAIQTGRRVMDATSWDWS